MVVPFVDLSRLVRELAPAVTVDWAACLEAPQLVGGPRVTELEAVMAAAFGAKHAVACASGSAALVLALRALDLPPGARVAVPNLTFWATYEAVVHAGLEPVLVDVDGADLQLSLPALLAADDEERARGGPGLAAAVYVHLFGWTSGRLDELRATCAARSIALVEDGAQAAGVERSGVSVFAGASLATLSFYPAKVLGGAMDGGAVLAEDERVAARVRALANHGRVAHYRFEAVGYNSRMAALQAAYLLRVFERRDAILADRRASLAHYAALLGAEPGLVLHGPPAGVTGNGYLAVVTSSAADGETLAAALTARGVGNARSYPETVDEQVPARAARRAGPLAVSQTFARRVVNLPLFYRITEVEREAAARALIDAHREARVREGNARPGRGDGLRQDGPEPSPGPRVRPPI